MASTAGENQRTPRVFISYSHDSAEHSNRVLELATRLRADGLNAELDQFENLPPQGWPLWCAQQIIDSNYVLMICTALYRDRFLGLEDFGKGRGVKWEAKVIQNILYYNEVNSGFIPVIFDPSDEEHIPETVKEASWYLISQNGQDSSGYIQLRQRLAGGKTFPPLPTPLPSEAYRQRDDASVPTQEVWDSSGRVEEKLDNLRRLQKRQYLTVMASFAVLALLLIAGIIWFKLSTQKIVTDPEILRAKLEEKIKQSFEQQHKELVSRKATPVEMDRLYRAEEGALKQVSESVRFIESTTKDAQATIAKNAAQILQEDGVDRALKYLDQTISAEAQGHKERGRELAEASLLEAELQLSKLDYDSAQGAIKQAIDFDYQWWESHNRLGLLFYRKAQWNAAEAEYREAQRFVDSEGNTATILNNLATLYYSMGDYAKAESLFQRALKIREKALGPDHPETAQTLNNLARMYESMGDYARAEPLLQRALKIAEKALGPDHPNTAETLNNLARLYESMGDYARAEPLLQRALKIREKALGPDHPDTAQTLDDLAVLYSSLSDYAKAEPLLQRALKIREETLGPDHPDTAQTLNDLAGLYRSTGDYGKAESLLQRTLEIREKALGPDHPDTGQTLNDLAGLYESMADYAKAEPLYQRALKIREKALGRDHPDTANSLNDLALVKIALGETENALPLAKRAQQAKEKYLSNILSFSSEQQRLTFQETTTPYTLLATLGSAAELAQTVLRQKGVVLDSLLEDRFDAEASADPKQREIIAQLRGAKQRLMQLVLEVPKNLSEAAQKQRTAEKEKFSTEVEQLEARLARQVAGLGKARRALSITVPQVQSVLPKQTVLIELLRYSHYLGKRKFENRYGAVVISPRGEPKWVPLGAATEIEKDIKLYQQSVRGKTDEATLGNVLKTMGERVWEPIERALPAETKTVIISPDGELSFVSFATLLTPDDRFLCEKYSISYVASGRDLLRENKLSDNPTTVVFANPDFHRPAITQAAGSSSAVALRSREMPGLRHVWLAPLPGTAKEAADLEKLWGKAVKVFLGPNATEAELRQVSSPRVLHLATTGFFLPELELGNQTDPLLQQPSEMPKTKLENPMYRSCLALAGAQSTLEAWSRGEVPPTENDGIVTAEEVSGLKLNGTWLVVLSAPDTGSGEARTGEGVLGLRRGFMQAGAENLLMTLWSINDAATVQIMLDFYEVADRTHNAPEALAEVQRDWLVKLRKELGLRAAVKLAGPFIMASQGKP